MAFSRQTFAGLLMAVTVMAEAEVFQCIDAKGKAIFTDNRLLCQNPKTVEVKDNAVKFVRERPNITKSQAVGNSYAIEFDSQSPSYFNGRYQGNYQIQQDQLIVNFDKIELTSLQNPWNEQRYPLQLQEIYARLSRVDRDIYYPDDHRSSMKQPLNKEFTTGDQVYELTHLRFVIPLVDLNEGESLNFYRLSVCISYSNAKPIGKRENSGRCDKYYGYLLPEQQKRQ